MTGLAVRGDQEFFTEAQLGVLRQMFPDERRQPSRADLAALLHYSQRTGLDPFLRQVYMIERGGKWGIQAGIDALRIVAQRSGDYQGQVGPLWCGEDREWVDVWLDKTPPKAAKVGVLRDGFKEPLWAVARWDSYAANSPTWQKMPDLMLAKCAEALALRKAFPQDLAGIYTEEEMDQAGPVQHVASRVVDADPTPSQAAGGAPVVTDPDPVLDQLRSEALEALTNARGADEAGPMHDGALDVLREVWRAAAGVVVNDFGDGTFKTLVDVDTTLPESDGGETCTLGELILWAKSEVELDAENKKRAAAAKPAEEKPKRSRKAAGTDAPTPAEDTAPGTE